MRFLKYFFLILLASSFLMACGDGGSDSGASAGNSGSDSNLIAVYDKINKGTTYAQIQAMIGYAHNGGQQEGGPASLGTYYKWTSSSGYTALGVFINTSGATAKALVAGQAGISSSKTF